MREEAITIGIRSLADERESPQKPELTHQGWSAGTQKGVVLENVKRGRIDHSVVRMMLPNGTIAVWDQPVIDEHPGVIFAPIRRIGEGNWSRYLLYFIVTDRPIVQTRSNNTRTLVENRSVSSIEFPRGIGEKTAPTFQSREFLNQSRVAILGSQSEFCPFGGDDEREEAPTLVILPGAQPIPCGLTNPNTSLFATNQGNFVIPITPRSAEEGLETISDSQQKEGIKKLIPLEFPQETDQILERSSTMALQGNWNSTDPILICGYTKALLAEIERLVRANKIPVTG